MPQYVALTYTKDVDWTAPENAEEMAEYEKFGATHGAVIRGGAALYQTSTATTVRVKEALTGFYLIEAGDLDEAVRIAADLPAAWDGAVEVRPTIDFGG